MSYTPGPWVIERDKSYVIEIGPLCAKEYAGAAWVEVPEADARLISAAPDLLEAAKLVLAWYEAENNHEGTTFWERAEMCRVSEAALRAAIAKAEGAK